MVEQDSGTWCQDWLASLVPPLEASRSRLAGKVGLIFGMMVFCLAMFACGSGSNGVGSQVPEAVGTQVPIEGQNHVNAGTSVSYLTTPPTSGRHWPTPAECGIHETQVPDEQVVHNMEHGHVIISYNLPDSNDAARFLEISKTLPDVNRWSVVRPYGKIEPGTVALTAWGVMDTLTSIDEDRITTFYNTYTRNRFSEETASVGPIPCRP